MIVECLQRHLAVCAVADLPSFTKRDPKFWNVISLLGPQTPNPVKVNFRDHHRAHFDDVADAKAGTGGTIVNAATMRAVLKFVDDRSGQPILVHCVMGISRSPAAALVLLLRGLISSGEERPAQAAVETLLTIRPIARPNPLVLEIGLQCFLSEGDAKHTTNQVMERLRFLGSASSESA